MAPHNANQLAGSELADILTAHAYRGVRVQLVLRALLVVFMALTLAFVPPDHGLPACWAILAGYAAFEAAVTVWTARGGPGPVRWMWLALLVDAAALSAVTLVAGVGSAQSWTADVLINGFFVIPLLAATQLRPMVCLAVTAPTTVAYFVVSVATKDANGEPWSSILLRTLVLAGLSAAAVALSAVQRSRVRTIAGLVGQRADLLREMVGIETRERADLAEQLHDGALQYLLAARQDLDDARQAGDPASFDRVEQALVESARLLRSTVTELHPAVLDQAGLARALHSLADGFAERGRLAIAVDVDGWPDQPTPDDAILYSAARELLANVVKHSGARTATLGLHRREDGTAELVVSDDGCGIADGQLERQLADGHIGLASHRARITAAGGQLTVASRDAGGTSVTVRLGVS